MRGTARNTAMSIGLKQISDMTFGEKLWVQPQGEDCLSTNTWKASLSSDNAALPLFLIKCLLKKVSFHKHIIQTDNSDKLRKRSFKKLQHKEQSQRLSFGELWQMDGEVCVDGPCFEEDFVF